MIAVALQTGPRVRTTHRRLWSTSCRTSDDDPVGLVRPFMLMCQTSEGNNLCGSLQVIMALTLPWSGYGVPWFQFRKQRDFSLFSFPPSSNPGTMGSTDGRLQITRAPLAYAFFLAEGEPYRNPYSPATLAPTSIPRKRVSCIKCSHAYWTGSLDGTRAISSSTWRA